MCRFIAYHGDPIFLEQLVCQPRHSLVRQALRAEEAKTVTNGDGFGIGWYAERAVPGTYRDILPAWNDANLRSIAHQIRSGLFLAHVRASTGTATSRANCHPFSHGKWLFMHNGQIGGYDRIRRRIEALVDDSFYVHRLGTTDSELIFYLMLSMGLDTNPVNAIQRTLGAAVEIMQAAGIAEPLRFTSVVTDGASIFAIRFATDETPPSLYWRYEDDQLLIVSEPLDDDQRCWHEVPAGQMLVTERNVRVDMVPFRPALSA